MSIIPTTSPVISSRIQRLRHFLQAIESKKGVNKAIALLSSRDRKKILGSKQLIEFAWSKLSKKTLKGRVEKLLMKSKKKLIIDRFQNFPIELTNYIGLFLTGKDLAKFRRISRKALEITSAAYIIETYQLAPLIKKHIDIDCKPLTEAGKIWAISRMMAHITRMNHQDNLPLPTYSSIQNFFAQIEERFFNRMLERTSKLYLYSSAHGF